MSRLCVACLLWFLTSMNGVSRIRALEIPEHLRHHAKLLHDRCQAQTGVAEELIVQSSTGNLPSDRTLQCYIHCLFDKVGLIDNNHVVHLENIIEILPAETHSIVQNLVSVCGTKHGADGCETAYLTVKCYFEADPEVLKKHIASFLN